MKKIPLFLSLLMMGCTTSYVAQFQHNEEYPSEQHEFQDAASNRLEVSHAFNNSNGSVSIIMENKTDQPILIDMTKSAYTVNREAFPFVDGRAFIFGSIRMFGQGTGINAVFEGVIEQTPTNLFLPPQSFIVGSYLNIRRQIIETAEDKLSSSWAVYPVFDQNIESKNAFFQAANSPLQIISRISYSELDQSNQALDTVVLSQHLYLSSFSQIREISRSELEQKVSNREDMASYRRSKGMIWYLIIPAAMILGLAAVVGE